MTAFKIRVRRVNLAILELVAKVVRAKAVNAIVSAS